MADLPQFLGGNKSAKADRMMQSKLEMSKVFRAVDITAHSKLI
jgi:hypothetical protein